MAYRSDLILLDEKFLRHFYDKEEKNIVLKYTILVENDPRYIQIPDNMMNEYRYLCNARHHELTHLIRSQYANKYLHMSPNPVSIDTMKDMSKETGSWTEKGEENPLYYNPFGLWLSCGTAWLDWLRGGCNQWIKYPYVYEIDVNKDTVLKIRNMNQFRNFTKKYRNPDASSLDEMIDWPAVKKDYDGLIICPYLGEKIWKISDPTIYTLGKGIVDYIETALDTKVFEVDAFIYEWYRHWEAATGVVWRPSGIKSINLVEENHWHEKFMEKLEKSLMDGKSLPQSRVSPEKAAGIKILTYNVSWQSTSGKRSDWTLCNNADDEADDRHFTKCIRNMVNFIDENGPYDFVCLQEITNLDWFIKESKMLSAMSYETHKSGPEEMVTFWDGEKYHLAETKNGEFKPGRPYQILVFEEKICLINLHLPHTNKYRVKQNLQQMFGDLGTKYQGYRFIMAGDFNYAMNHGDKKVGFLPKLVMNNTSFYINPTYILTCCMPPFPKYKLHFDHVLDSLATPESVSSPTVGSLASDHLPIVAILMDKKITNMERIYRHKRFKLNIY